jgi:hypothetical protein
MAGKLKTQKSPRPRTAATPAECVVVLRIDGETICNGTFPFKMGVALSKAWAEIRAHARAEARHRGAKGGR